MKFIEFVDVVSLSELKTNVNVKEKPKIIPSTLEKLARKLDVEYDFYNFIKQRLLLQYSSI